METRILVLDNYDSFTYNIVQIVKDLGYKVDVYGNYYYTPYSKTKKVTVTK